MTEKELMNEAYEWRKHIKSLVTATDDELYHKRSKVFDWLMEQAERVEELEKEKDEWKDTAQSYYMTNQELREQNKRYREALKEIARGRFSGASYKARKALEGEAK